MSLLPAPKGLPADPPGNRSDLRVLDRRPGPAAVSGAATRNFRKGEKMKKKKNKKKKTEKWRETRSKGTNSSLQSGDPLDRVPAGLARVVVNMQQHYASGVSELAEKLGIVEDELRRAKEENVEMMKRLDMHFGMLGQTAEFMQKISEGLGGAMAGEGKEGEEEEEEGEEGEKLNQGVDDGGDLAMDGVDMEVPPTPVDDDRLPMRSTGRMASNRRMAPEKSPAQRKTGKEKKKRLAASVLPIREKMAHSQDDEDDDDEDDEEEEEDGANLISLGEEQRPHGREDGNSIDGGEDDARILQGAPRLQDIMLQDAIRRGAIRPDVVIRRSRFTPINRAVPSRQRTPSVDDYSDSDEYRPSSPSAASCASSASSSSESPPSLYEEEIAAKPAPLATTQLQTPPPTSSSSASSSTASPSSKPRYSVARRTTVPRYAPGPPGKPFRFHRMGRTVLEVWVEYKAGSRGNPAIEALERQYGTEWRTGKDIRELKYASNYVSVRQKVVGYVEDLCERQGISAEEACGRLDERVDGRMQMLISAVRKGQDPFVVIPKR